ncbi:MAG: 6,7-dimethyl-8-ribityllumazine synthase [Chloroflexi bacterium]|nr:6,7-dimethyl-8-ribityllumazine synthase [Chloroflexota bacterium]
MPWNEGREPDSARIGIVVARFNELITNRMLEGALSALSENGVPDDSIDLAYVPGSFEIGSAAQAMAETGRYAAVICIGAVIRGETAHFDYVSMAVTQSVTRVSLDTGVPCMFGVLTTDTMEQALARSGGPGSNRGYDAAAGALEMAGLVTRIESTRPD